MLVQKELISKKLQLVRKQQTVDKYMNCEVFQKAQCDLR